MKSVILILFIFCVNSLFAQKQFNNWYGLKQNEKPTAFTFNTLSGSPRVILPNQLYNGTPASISDKNGQLLFYTNGINVYNKNHQIMENGTGLFGEDVRASVYSNQTLIVPQPGKSDIFWIFTTGIQVLSFTQAWETSNGPSEDVIRVFGNNNGLNYSIVDMSKNDGLGSVIEKNHPMMIPCSGQVNSVLHKNSKDVWIVASKSGTIFSAYLLTENGIEMCRYSKFEPIVSDTLYKYGIFGPIVKSLDGTKIASSFVGHWDPHLTRTSNIRKLIPPHFEIYDFDNSTGKLTNRKYFINFYKDSTFLKYYKDSIKIDTLLKYIDTNYTLGIVCLKLSPDGSKLYMIFRGQPNIAVLGNRIYQFLFQFDLTLDSASMINNCVVLDYHDVVNDQYTNMQIGPDKKIYLADIASWITHYAVIDRPNMKGIKCNYRKRAINAGVVPHLLPNDVFLFPFIVAKPVGDTICFGETLVLKANVNSAMPTETITWDGPNGFSSNDSNLVFPNATDELTGWYKVTATSNGDTITDSVYVIVFPKNPDTLRIIPSDSTRLCRLGTVKLGINKPRDDYKYLWSTGDTTESIIINTEGKYYVTISDSNGCEQFDSVKVYLEDLTPEIEIIGNIPACEGDTIVLRTKEKYDVYNWSTGDTTSEIYVTKSTRCSVSVIDSLGCTGTSEEVEVMFYPKPKVNLRGPDTVCLGSTVTYRVNKNNNVGYGWWVELGSLVPGFHSDSAKVIWLQAGKGKIVSQQTNSYGCVGKDSMFVEIIDEVKPEIIPKKPVICGNGTLTLKTSEQYDSYEWSTGETSDSIVVSSARMYFVKVTADGGCTGYDTVNVIKAEEPLAVIIGNTTLCRGESSVLSVAGDYAKYLWNTGETTKDITVNQTGNYTVEVTDSNGCKASASVDVKQIIISLDGLIDTDFGKISIDNKDNKNLILTNKSNESIRIEDVRLKSGNGELSIIAIPQTPVILDSGEAMTININFEPDYMQEYADSLIIEISEPCEELFSSNVSGIGTGKMLVWLPVLSKEVGYNICIPLYAKLMNTKPITLDTKFDTEIRYDATALKPENDYAIVGTNRIVDFNNKDLSISKDTNVIAELCGTVLLAKENTTPIFISDFTLSNPYCEIETLDGSLTILGCSIDISRIMLIEPIEVSLTPNPGKDEIDLSIKSTYHGQIDIRIYNTLGNLVYTENVNKTADIEHYSILLNNFGSGLYFYYILTNGAV
ncbi:MAG: T9SS type A sorting domain-containing protein, partial [bacterium]